MEPQSHITLITALVLFLLLFTSAVVCWRLKIVNKFLVICCIFFLLRFLQRYFIVLDCKNPGTICTTEKRNCQRLSKVEEFVQALHGKLEDLELVRNTAQSQLRVSNVTTLIKQMSTLLEDLEAKNKLDSSTEFDCDEMVLLPKGMRQDVGRADFDTISILDRL